MEMNVEPSVGMTVKVTYTEERYSNDPTEGLIEEEHTDEGEIVAVPSRKFDWEGDDFEFDYELHNGSAVRSVDLDRGKVCQLSYEGGRDRD
jgi:hypothetical protein